MQSKMAKNAQDFRKQKQRENLKKQLAKDGITEEQLEHNRKQQKKVLEVDIQCLGREKKYKQDQLDSGNILEKNESRLFNTSSFPKDEVKPKFILENEISVIDRLLIDKQNQLDNLKCLQN